MIMSGSVKLDVYTEYRYVSISIMNVYGKRERERERRVLIAHAIFSQYIRSTKKRVCT